MKKTLIILALATAAVTSGLAQGTIFFGNSNGSKISTNAVVGGGAVGPTSVAVNGVLGTEYYYALFYSTASGLVDGSSTAVVGAGNYAFNDSNWTFLNPSAITGYVTGPAYATNGAAGRYTPENTDSGHGGATITANTTAANWVIIGWSATDGSTLTALESWYNGGAPATAGWIGESVVGASQAPADPTTTPAGTTPSVFPGAFTLGEIAATPAPEPATLALAGLGGLSMLLIRRRRKS
jgi:hypothetical protein